jgi:hypothetical protein
MVVVADHPAGESRSEDVAVPAVAAVEALGIDAVQVLHPGRHLLRRRLDDQVVVRVHQAEGMAFPPVPADDEGQQRQEEQAVGLVDEDRSPEDAARRHVQDAVW